MFQWSVGWTSGRGALLLTMLHVRLAWTSGEALPLTMLQWRLAWTSGGALLSLMFQ